MEGSAKQPPISERFQKFALAFKTKTMEFFAEEEEEDAVGDEFDGLSLLDSAEEIITGQRVVVIKPDQDIKPATPSSSSQASSFTNLQILHTLFSSLFATLSSFEASYLLLQTAHDPFDEDTIKAADRASVSHLQKLLDIKNCYSSFRKNPSLNPKFPFLSPLEAQVGENQNKLRSLEMVVNRLQSEIDHKDGEVSMMKQKLGKIQKSNLRLSKRLSELNCSSSLSSTTPLSFTSPPEVLLSVGLFNLVLQDACKSTRSFTKLLIDLMEKDGWDLDLVANYVHPDIEYVKRGHNRYALLSYVCLGMFQGFDSEGFSLREHEIECNGNGKGVNLNFRRKNSLKQFVEHGTGDAMEILSRNPNGDFATFCDEKYQKLIHTSMESSLFRNFDQNELELNSWKSSMALYESFVNMASSIWMLHKLAFSFNPIVEIFQVERGVDFSMVFMENVTQRSVTPGKTRAKVGFTVTPGFRIGRTIIQSQVYLIGMRCVE
ncbi:hypothetical protein HHK36_028698 [Tetracentron sinense]|uniref:DUF641 domain-containing protein n=1 Tax=Tetracentron sinense TaxID=13715 RepID=A0A834YFH9_TETSI|nr:hypothetical protein HHK36_028698 [Tetracentron sinense]